MEVYRACLLCCREFSTCISKIYRRRKYKGGSLPLCVLGVILCIIECKMEVVMVGFKDSIFVVLYLINAQLSFILFVVHFVPP